MRFPVTVQPSAEQNKKTSCDYADFLNHIFIDIHQFRVCFSLLGTV